MMEYNVYLKVKGFITHALIITVSTYRFGTFFIAVTCMQVFTVECKVQPVAISYSCSHAKEVKNHS